MGNTGLLGNSKYFKMGVKCQECTSVFSNKTNLYAHERKFHNRKKMPKKQKPVVMCKICLAEFKYKHNLYLHKKMSHNGHNKKKRNPEGKCEECGSEFNHKRNLYAHERKFHNRKLVPREKKTEVKCEKCAAEFRHKRNLYAHEREFHNRKLPEKKIIVNCDKCGRGFSSKQNLFIHAKKFHKSDLFECEICDRLLSSEPKLLRHKLRHKKDMDNDYTKPSCNKSRLCCPQEYCIETFWNYENLRSHLNDIHKVKVEKEEHEFTSLESFEQWKDIIQQKQMSRYTLDTAPKKLKCEVEAWNLLYNCHRPYFYVRKGTTNDSRTILDSHKSGKACPSRMIVTLIRSIKQPSSIKVQYWKTHFGHELHLDSRTRAEISGKLRKGVKFCHILDEIRNNVVNKQDINLKLSILEQNNVQDVLKDFNINNCTKLHQDDAISVKKWVSEMQGLVDNPVLYYKGRNELDKNTSLNVDDFAMIMMTVYQAEQLIKFGKNKICIDSTHGTNNYDIQLYTIMIVDEFGTGCPVSYCFSNRCDEYIFLLFFNLIKQKIGIVNTKLFMSDDVPVFHNTWSLVMGKVDQKLLCSWHVDKNWRLNLSKITGEVGKKLLVYRSVKMLQQITNETEFQTFLAHMQYQLDNDNDTKYFGDYFKRNYANRPECWAYCYRKGLGINTMESFHKILNHIYLEGRKLGRLDITVNAVLKVSRDNLLNVRNITKSEITQNTQQINFSHESSQAITTDSIRTVEKNKQWIVISSSSSFVHYHVSLIGETCSNLCLACSVCNICIHSFQCSCNDNIIKLNICEHIHACARVCFANSCCKTELFENLEDTS